ncbi:MAG: glycosyl hydrolase family 25 [Eubacterium sp.]|nr:glycosyl hydrolase family 25 [Eubacterium sp.]
MKKAVIILTIIIAVIVAILLTLLGLAKSKKILINPWFVNEEKSTIGVDISSYQADVDMEKLKEQGIEFIYIKATEGSSHQDSRFSENWANAKEANLVAGAYHFFSYDSPGKTQAENFIETVGTDIKGRLLPAVDVELYADKEENHPDKEAVVTELSDFLNILEKTYGVKPIIYTHSSIYEEYFDEDFTEYRVWMASLYTPLFLNYNGDWDIWQYLNKGELEGYSGGEKYIDLDVLNRHTKLDDLIVK